MRADEFDATKPKVVYSWRRNAREEFRATTLEYEGHDWIDLRVWRCDHFGDRPTRRGIRIPVEDASELVAAAAALDKLGRIHNPGVIAAA